MFFYLFINIFILIKKTKTNFHTTMKQRKYFMQSKHTHIFLFASYKFSEKIQQLLNIYFGRNQRGDFEVSGYVHLKRCKTSCIKKLYFGILNYFLLRIQFILILKYRNTSNLLTQYFIGKQKSNMYSDKKDLARFASLLLIMLLWLQVK